MAEENLDRAARHVLQAVMVRAAVAAGDYPAMTGRRLASQLDLRARAEATGNPVERAGAGDRALCAFLATILSRRGPDVHDYLTGAFGYRPERATGLRHHCGRELLGIELVPHWAPARPRELYICERCGPAYSLPHGFAPPSRLRVDPTALRVEFNAPLVQGGWFAASRQPIGGHREHPLLPRALAPGAGALEARIPTGAGPGLRRFAAALVVDGDYAIFQVPDTI
ncbi:hypothetical protein ACIGXM_34810 [Kitasatospora sp. NPDC052896]|uniref:hypothetical protein n=1 Tax=Kitasatospora sp. NPDC052896 TaxID=3364061 RepID=UPI0037C5ADBB